MKLQREPLRFLAAIAKKDEMANNPAIKGGMIHFIPFLPEFFQGVDRKRQTGYRKNGELTKVSQVKVKLGKRTDYGLETLSGLKPGDRLEASKASFLADADTVQRVQP